MDNAVFLPIGTTRPKRSWGPQKRPTFYISEIAKIAGVSNFVVRRDIRKGILTVYRSRKGEAAWAFRDDVIDYLKTGSRFAGECTAVIEAGLKQAA